MKPINFNSYYNIVGYYRRKRNTTQEKALGYFLRIFQNGFFRTIHRIRVRPAWRKDVVSNADFCVIVGWNENQRNIAKYYKSIPKIVIFPPPIRAPFNLNIPFESSYVGVFWDSPYGYYKYETLSSDRWKRLKNRYKIKIKPWRKKGEHIVIAHQPNPDFNGKSRNKFYNSAVKKSLRTGRRVIISERPFKDDFVLDDYYKEKWSKMGCEFTKGISNCLDNAYCLITAGGTSDFHAIFNGVPAYTKEVRISTPLMKQRDLTQFLKNPPTPNRTKWFNWIAYQQWTVDELCGDELITYLTWIKNSNILKRKEEKVHVRNINNTGNRKIIIKQPNWKKRRTL